jgi:hypothetical protein
MENGRNICLFTEATEAFIAYVDFCHVLMYIGLPFVSFF